MRSDKKGFTVVELMAATAVTLIVAAGFFGAFFAMRNGLRQQSAYHGTNQAIRYGLDKISKDTKEAVAVVSSWGGNNYGTSTLILRLPAIDNAGEPTNIASQFDYVTYRLSGTQLLRSLDVLGGTSAREGGLDRTDDVVATGVSGLTFSSGGTALGSIASGSLAGIKVLNVQITASGSTRGSTQTSQIDSDLMLRNNLT